MLYLDLVEENLPTYEVVWKEGRPTLKNKPNDDCIYLTEEGCGIYDRRPNSCRVFDCRPLIGHPGIPLRVQEAAKRAEERSGNNSK